MSAPVFASTTSDIYFYFVIHENKDLVGSQFYTIRGDGDFVNDTTEIPYFEELLGFETYGVETEYRILRKWYTLEVVREGVCSGEVKFDPPIHKEGGRYLLELKKVYGPVKINYYFSVQKSSIASTK